MEEKVLTEKESLELISQMIQSTKKNRPVSPGKELLYWGYFTSILALTIYLLINFTSSGIWSCNGTYPKNKSCLSLIIKQIDAMKRMSISCKIVVC